MRLFRVMTCTAAALLVSGAADATILKLTVTGTYDATFDPATGTQTDLPSPQAFTATATLPLATWSVDDQGPDIYTVYDASGLAITSPFSASVGPDPVGNGLAGPAELNAMAHVESIRDATLTSFTLSQFYNHQSPTQGWQYLTRISIAGGTLPGMTPGIPYSLTPDRLVTFLDMQIGKPADFETSWNETAFDSQGNSIYRAGQTWVNPTAVLSAVELVPDVPEPGTWSMFIAGLTGIGLSARRQRKLSA